MTSTKRQKTSDEAYVENEFNRLGAQPRADASTNYQKATNTPYDYKHMDEVIVQYSQQCSESADEPKLVCCPRSYEEDFLREPIGNERACIKNNECQGLNITGASGFILREFILPGEEPAQRSTRSLCLMCRRYEISRQHFLYESRHASLEKCISCSPYYNIVGVPGEYDIRDCIVSQGRHTGLLLPVVLHIRSAYMQCTRNGVRAYEKRGVRDPRADNLDNAGGFLLKRAGLLQHSLAH